MESYSWWLDQAGNLFQKLAGEGEAQKWGLECPLDSLVSLLCFPLKGSLLLLSADCLLGLAAAQGKQTMWKVTVE